MEEQRFKYEDDKRVIYDSKTDKDICMYFDDEIRDFLLDVLNSSEQNEKWKKIEKEFNFNKDILNSDVYGVLNDWRTLVAKQKNKKDSWTEIPSMPGYAFKNLRIESPPFKILDDKIEASIEFKYDEFKLKDDDNEL